MKSTKVQNPRCIPRIKPIMRVYWPPIAVQPRSVLAATQASCIMHTLGARLNRYSNNPPRSTERTNYYIVASGVTLVTHSPRDCRGVGSQNYMHAHYL